jgi:hypothetical protein
MKKKTNKINILFSCSCFLALDPDPNSVPHTSLNPYPQPCLKKVLYYSNEQMYESEGCVLVSSSGLLVGVVLQDETVVTAATWVGRGRRRLCHADLATASPSGQFMLATCGNDTPIAIYAITCSLNTQEWTVVTSTIFGLS